MAQELSIQRFLRDGNTIEDVKEMFGISPKRHQKFNNLISFKYSQTESQFGLKVVRECRGIILDENDNWNVVARPFDKFFNSHEGFADKLSGHTTFYEKLDGSFVMLYYYGNQWNVATSSTPDAHGNVRDFGFTFADLFWKTLGDNLPTSTEHCFFFELTSQYNRVVVRYTEERLTLIGARHMPTQKEITPQEASKFIPNIPVVKTFACDLTNVANSFESISPLSQEGYVVVDDAFRRVKIKHPGYVALHHNIAGNSKKAFVEVIRSGEVSEVISCMPEFSEEINLIKKSYDDLVAELNSVYLSIPKDVSQKEFAEIAKKTRCGSALFFMRAGKVKRISEYIRDMNIDNLMKILAV